MYNIMAKLQKYIDPTPPPPASKLSHILEDILYLSINPAKMVLHWRYVQHHH